ncbi:hypothetical protein ASE08_12610 [Rhizobacter sp. Root16D2]|nr:hypothetical protein ASC88_16380 [Rhizobacter sp. Root29]KQW04641.1 hypothetical protein ASC98_06070 [Rhizobacter sp. Root1238]KRB06480.1 hypothetical protein ASE08_12610 [Rhizobacter sp. Root16D2]
MDVAGRERMVWQQGFDAPSSKIFFEDPGRCEADADPLAHCAHDRFVVVEAVATLHGDLLTEERPETPGWQSRIQYAVVEHQVSWRCRLTSAFEVFSAREHGTLGNANLSRDQHAAFQGADAYGQVEALCDEIDVFVGQMQFDFQLRMSHEQRRNQWLHMQQTNDHRAADAQKATRLVFTPSHRFGLGDRVERAPGFDVIALPLDRRRQLARGPMQQPQTEMRFERADVSTDVGLPDAQFTRRRGEAAGFDRSHEALHPQQLAGLPTCIAALNFMQ